MHIGNRLKEILKEKGLNQTHLADKMSVSRQMISSLINSENITTDTLEKIIKALDITYTDFFRETAINDMELLIKRYKHSILNLRSYLNNEAINGRGAIGVKFQEDLFIWNIVWGELKKPISKLQYENTAMDIMNETKLFFL